MVRVRSKGCLALVICTRPLYVLEEQPCCIGGADSEALKPIYEKCGLGCYSILVTEAEIN